MKESRFRLVSAAGRSLGSTVAACRWQAVRDFKGMFEVDGRSEVTGWWWWRLRLRGEPVRLKVEPYPAR